MSPPITAIDSYLTITYLPAPYTGSCRGQPMFYSKTKTAPMMSIKYISLTYRHNVEKRQRNQLAILTDAVICWRNLKPGPLTQNRDDQWNSLWVYQFLSVTAHTSQCIIKHHAMKMDGAMFPCIYNLRTRLYGSGQIHALVASPQGRIPGTHWVEP
jgi:hypothetical protein